MTEMPMLLSGLAEAAECCGEEKPKGSFQNVSTTDVEIRLERIFAKASCEYGCERSLNITFFH